MRWRSGRWLAHAGTLWVLFFVLSSVTVANVVLAVWGVEGTAAALRSAAMERSRKMELAERVEHGVFQLWLAVSDGDPEAMDRTVAEVQADLEALRPLVRTPTGKERLAAVEASWRECSKEIAAKKTVSASRMQ